MTPDAPAVYAQRTAAIRDALRSIEAALVAHETKQVERPLSWEFAADVAAAEITLRQVLDCLTAGL